MRAVTEGTQGTQGTRLRMAWKDASAVAMDVMAMIAPYVELVTVAGSVRRLRESCGDIDIVAIPKAGGAVRIAQMLRELHCGEAKEYRAGDKMASAVVGHGRYGLCGPGGRQEREAQVDVYFATPENFGMLLCVRTGSAQHNIYMAKLAQRMGMKFAASEGIVQNSETRNQNAELPRGRTEEEVFGALGLLVPEPRVREIVRGHPIWMDGR